jgi:hypothetical protein
MRRRRFRRIGVPDVIPDEQEEHDERRDERRDDPPPDLSGGNHHDRKKKLQPRTNRCHPIHSHTAKTIDLPRSGRIADRKISDIVGHVGV